MIQNDTINQLCKDYEQAVFKESVIRESSFLPITKTICGIEVKQFTPYHYMLLDFINSPYLGKSNEIAGEDRLQFLWVVSTQYKDNDPEGKKKFFDFILKEVKAVNIDEEIREYIDKAFLDLSKSTETNPEKAPFVAWICPLIDSVASEYHWDEEKILHMPVARLLQYQKTIGMRRLASAGTTPDSFNNLSDPIKWAIRKELKRVEDAEKEAAKKE